MHSFGSSDRGPVPIWLLAVSLSLLALPAVGGAAVLCGKTNPSTGELREGSELHVRSTCKATEQQVTLTALGLESKYTVRAGNQITTNGALSTPAICEPGEVATGGGAIATGNNGGNPAIRSSRPQPDTVGSVPTSWRTTVANQAGAGTITVTAYAVCVAP